MASLLPSTRIASSDPVSIMLLTAGTKNGTIATDAAIPTSMNTENPTEMTLNCGATRDSRATATCAASRTAMTGNASHRPI